MSGAQSAHDWHGHVKNDRIGVQFFRQTNGFSPVSSLAADFPLGAVAQHRTNSLTNDCMVIHNEYSHCHSDLHFAGETEYIPWRLALIAWQGPRVPQGH